MILMWWIDIGLQLESTQRHPAVPAVPEERWDVVPAAKAGAAENIGGQQGRGCSE